MADDIVRIVGGWQVRTINGVQRVSGTELGRKLKYNVAKPSEFNRKVIEKLRKDEKFKDLDVVSDRSYRKRGFAQVEVTEYWPTPAAARRIIMEVETDTAKEIQRSVIAQLENLQKALAELPSEVIVTAPAEPTHDAITATVERVLGDQGSNIAKLIMKAVEDGLRPLEKGLDQAAKMIERVHGYYIDDDRRLQLNHLSRIIAARKGKGESVSNIWKGVRVTYDLRSGRTFSTVPRDLFDQVYTTVKEMLTHADAEADMERLEKAKHEKAAARRAQQAAKKETAPSNVVRSTKWRKRR
jgi:hypothetical protein